MKLYKYILPLAAALGMLTACGDGFKSRQIVGESDLDKMVGDIKANGTDGETPVTVDQEIFNTYLADINGMDRGRVQALAESIEAFEVNVDLRLVNGEPSDDVSNVRATVQTDCNTLWTVRNSEITLDALVSMERVELGRMGPYEINVECTDSECNEMVAAVTHFSNGTNTLIFLGLKKQASTNIGTSHNIKFIADRNVAIPIWFTKAVPITEYNVACAQIRNSQTQRVSTAPETKEHQYFGPPAPSTFSGNTGGVINPTIGQQPSGSNTAGGDSFSGFNPYDPTKHQQPTSGNTQGGDSQSGFRPYDPNGFL